ncbi:unnamed protein product [Absidia cylindrospora]
MYVLKKFSLDNGTGTIVHLPMKHAFPESFGDVEAVLRKKVYHTFGSLRAYVVIVAWLRHSRPVEDLDCPPLQYLDPSFLRFVFPPHSTAASPFDSSGITLFWKAPMTPESRTVWFRILVSKYPRCPYLRQIGRASSSLCHLCNDATKDAIHFLVECPKKQEIWTSPPPTTLRRLV